MALNKKEQVDEIMKCGEEPMYFIKKYLYIQHPTKGRLPFELYKFQEQCIDDFLNYKDFINSGGYVIFDDYHDVEFCPQNTLLPCFEISIPSIGANYAKHLGQLLIVCANHATLDCGHVMRYKE